MRAGKLDRVITIERHAYTGETDAYGTPAQTFAPVATVRAQVIQASTEEFLRSYGTASESATVFRIRHLDGITTADRIIYEGAIHEIVEMKEIGRRRGLDLRTRATGSG